VLTDNEQDLLRAMLVMAAAGLDSMVKQLIAMPCRVLYVVTIRCEKSSISTLRAIGVAGTTAALMI
jgi:hypothetical protein